jgi:IPT/TIG domain.
VGDYRDAQSRYHGFLFSVNTPRIITLSPLSGPVGKTVTITGQNFGDGQGSMVAFGSTPVPSVSILSWSDTQIVVQVPDIVAGEYGVTVTISAGQSNAVPFQVFPPLTFDVTALVSNWGTKWDYEITNTSGGPVNPVGPPLFGPGPNIDAFAVDVPSADSSTTIT